MICHHQVCCYHLLKGLLDISTLNRRNVWDWFLDHAWMFLRRTKTHKKRKQKASFVLVKAVWEKGRKWNLKEKTVSCQGSGKLSSDYKRIVTPQGQLTWFVVQEWEPWYTDCRQPEKPNKVLWQELRETSHLLSPSMSFTTSMQIDMLPFVSNPGQGNEQLDLFKMCKMEGVWVQIRGQKMWLLATETGCRVLALFLVDKKCSSEIIFLIVKQC